MVRTGHRSIGEASRQRTLIEIFKHAARLIVKPSVNRFPSHHAPCPDGSDDIAGWLNAAARHPQALRIDSAIAGSRFETVRENGYVHERYPAVAAWRQRLRRILALRQARGRAPRIPRPLICGHPRRRARGLGGRSRPGNTRGAQGSSEYLTGLALNFPGVIAGNYVDALDGAAYLTALAQSTTRVGACATTCRVAGLLPDQLRTERVQQAERYDCTQRLAAPGGVRRRPVAAQRGVADGQGDPASFAIEHEEKQTDRIRRFAAVMERDRGTRPAVRRRTERTAGRILGQRATRYGMRRSPVFVGEVDGFTEIVHYIAPHWDDAPDLLSACAIAPRARSAPRPCCGQRCCRSVSSTSTPGRRQRPHLALPDQ